MGQYFMICNLDKHEFMKPNWFGHGLKLADIARAREGMMAGVAILIALSGTHLYCEGPIYGRWAGDRLAIIGDEYQGAAGGLTVDAETYDTISGQQSGWVDISEHVRAVLEGEWALSLPPALLDGAEPRSTLHADGTITPVSRFCEEPGV